VIEGRQVRQEALFDGNDGRDAFTLNVGKKTTTKKPLKGSFFRESNALEKPFDHFLFLPVAAERAKE